MIFRIMAPSGEVLLRTSMAERILVDFYLIGNIFSYIRWNQFIYSRKGIRVMKLAEKIMTLRKQRGWSQEELAQQLSVSRQSVW